MYKNAYEHKNFLVNALSWKGSVTPKVAFRILVTSLYSVVVVIAYHFLPEISLSFSPFELFGVVLGLLLVFRMNAGHDRWWEARKLWGGIVNQSRNLAYGALAYIRDNEFKKQILPWIIAYAYCSLQTLSGRDGLTAIKKFFNELEFQSLAKAKHMPSYVNLKLAQLLQEAKNRNYLDGFEFLQLDKERSELMDEMGASERILKTPMPLVYAIKLRRFILIFMLVLPFALLEKAGDLTPFFVILVAYPLFSLDQIGVELQNPFSMENLSHLPLEDICQTIESNIKDCAAEFNIDLCQNQ